MTDAADTKREARVRASLARQGHRLVKSRARDGRAPDFGGYMIVETTRNVVVAGELGGPRAMDLDQVETFANEL